jgi:hypothetical protein
LGKRNFNIEKRNAGALQMAAFSSFNVINNIRSSSNENLCLTK